MRVCVCVSVHVMWTGCD